MITNVGRNIINSNLAFGNSPISAIAIGTGGSDPVFGVPIAPSINDVALRTQIFFSETIDVIKKIGPPQSDFPRVSVRHTFFASKVLPTGVPINFIDEVGVFARDPETGLFVLVDRQTFNRKQFIVPANTASASRDFITLSYSFGVL